MFLTALYLDPGRPRSQRLLGDVYQMHCAVMSGFDDGTGDQQGPGRVLWRVDHQDPNSHVLYVQSARQPDYSTLAPQLSTRIVRCRSLDALWPRLRAGMRLRFRLTANPVRADKSSLDGKKARGIRVPHTTHDAQVTWLTQRSTTAGFTIPTNALGAPAVSISGREQARQTSRRTTRGVSLLRVTYDGLLEITDSALFQQTVTSGFGRGKGFGCGLITVAPPRI
jgi:CRISPR system Cascade subunit CasE